MVTRRTVLQAFMAGVIATFSGFKTRAPGTGTIEIDGHTTIFFSEVTMETTVLNPGDTVHLTSLTITLPKD